MMPDVLCQNADTVAQVGAVLWIATALLRPFVPPHAIKALGHAGKVIEVLSGNTRHCKNQHLPPVDQQDRETKRPK